MTEIGIAVATIVARYLRDYGCHLALADLLEKYGSRVTNLDIDNSESLEVLLKSCLPGVPITAVYPAETQILDCPTKCEAASNCVTTIATVARYLRENECEQVGKETRLTKPLTEAFANFTEEFQYELNNVDTSNAPSLEELLTGYLKTANNASGYLSCSAQYYDIHSGDQDLRSYDVTANVVDGAVLPSGHEHGKCLAVLFSNEKICLFELSMLTLVNTFPDPHRGFARAICSVDSTTVITGGSDGKLIVSNVQNGHVLDTVDAHEGSVQSVDVWMNYVVSAGYDRRIKVFQITKGSLNLLSTRNSLGARAVKIVKISNRMYTLVALDADLGQLELYPLDPLEEDRTINLRSFRREKFTPLSLALDETRTRFAVITDHRPYKQIITGSIAGEGFSAVAVHGIPWHDSSPNLAWGYSKNRLWVASEDGNIRAVYANDGKVVRSLSVHERAVSYVEVCDIDDQVLVITGGSDGSLKVWK